MISPAFLKRLEIALTLDLPYPERPPKLSGTAASVLILFGYQTGDSPENPRILVTRRTDQMVNHKGQMAFPGGSRDDDETERETALRETEEEVGIPREKIQIVGALPTLWTITDFWITPVVGVLTSQIEETPIRSNKAEIAETLWVPLSILKDPATYRKEWVERGPIRFPVHAYYVDSAQGQSRIWGATGAMIQNLLARLDLIK